MEGEEILTIQGVQAGCQTMAHWLSCSFQLTNDVQRNSSHSIPYLEWSTTTLCVFICSLCTHTVTGGTSKKRSSGDVFFPGKMGRTQCRRIPGCSKPPRVHPTGDSLELEITWTVPTVPGPPQAQVRGSTVRAVEQPKANLFTAQPTQNCQLLVVIPAFKEKGKADYRAVSTSAPGEREGGEGSTKLGEELKTHPSEQESILS